jgi:hypothetical protein
MTLNTNLSDPEVIGNYIEPREVGLPPAPFLSMMP